MNHITLTSAMSLEEIKALCALLTEDERHVILHGDKAILSSIHRDGWRTYWVEVSMNYLPGKWIGGEIHGIWISPS